MKRLFKWFKKIKNDWINKSRFAGRIRAKRFHSWVERMMFARDGYK